MDYYFDDVMGFDKLGLYYEVHMAGCDGECFNYSIYFENGTIGDKLKETENVITAYQEQYRDRDHDLGYTDVSKEDDKVNIYQDLGTVDEEHCDTAIKLLLTVLNSVSGIKTVILNEDCDFDF